LLQPKLLEVVTRRFSHRGTLHVFSGRTYRKQEREYQ
jgi:hypothetical protein